ncbi:zinc-binding dehydrogenase [Salinisphaera sp. Q1T1-3]|uniref:zinc-binding dehydrogenase n=1 Tax=Salinisphaera sp. Q1T1-3 TaxID=2321229 RepID=UPI001F1B1E0A|nr:zinc-binding dehydrogenase [Salinisphaera sp. Q1T1-3]
MSAVLLTGHGGLDRLVYRDDVPVPRPEAGQVLVQVTATAKNNTDRKAREGHYSTRDDDEAVSFAIGGKPTLTFPRIQGADVVGTVAAVGDGMNPARLGERGLLDFNIYGTGRRDINLVPDYFGHGADGGFAEYVVVPDDQFHAVTDPTLADAELAALGMCSYQTAYHMLTAADIHPGEHVLITGASGGVGTALIQLCRIIGAIPYASSTPAKAPALCELGAQAVFDRRDTRDFVARTAAATGGVPFDAVMDLVGGASTRRFIEAMTFDMVARTTYPRLSIAGASESNVSEIPWTLIYLYQVRIVGVSHGTRAEAEQLVHWIRAGRLRPVLQAAFPLSAIHDCERYFVDRAAGHLGKVVVVPDAQWATHGAPFALA